MKPTSQMKTSQMNITNSVIRMMRNKHPDANIYTKKTSVKEINNLINDFQNYPIIECSTLWFDQHIYWNNWVDTEGMGYGWLWVKNPQSKYRKLVVEWTDNRISDIRYDFKEKNKKFKNFKTIFIKDENYIIIYIPSRLICEYDLIIYLGKKDEL